MLIKYISKIFRTYRRFPVTKIKSEIYFENAMQNLRVHFARYKSSKIGCCTSDILRRCQRAWIVPMIRILRLRIKYICFISLFICSHLINNYKHAFPFNKDNYDTRSKSNDKFISIIRNCRVFWNSTFKSITLKNVCN